MAIELVEFTTETCKVCKLMQPVLDQVGKEYTEKLGYNPIVVKDFKGNYAEASSKGINTFPTFIAYRDGKQIGMRVGSADIGQLRELIKLAVGHEESTKEEPIEIPDHLTDPCPDCSATLMRSEGCLTCQVCGYSKCA